MYKIGEALIGKDNEIAHIDLMVGTKDGPVGQSFANGMVSLSQGHTPLLGVIRPNLPPKPHVLIVPKVTIKDMTDAGKIFGPAQAAVAKGVADAVAEGVLKDYNLDDIVIIASVFIHPDAKDYRKIYQYNYSATKLALRRAISDYPSLEKIMFEKDRATHAIMGFKVPRLPKWNAPYLQIALDVGSFAAAERVIKELPMSDKLLIEIGTPLVKAEGVKVINEIRKHCPNSFIIADLKALDVGDVEVDLAFDATADAVVVSGLGSKVMIEEFICEAEKLGIYSMVDTMNVKNSAGELNPMEMLKTLNKLPDIVLLHRGIAGEKALPRDALWGFVREIKEYGNTQGKELIVGVAGGIEAHNVRDAVEKGADIVVIGRAITQARDIRRSTEDVLRQLGGDIDLKRVHKMTD
ncbi:MAG: formaldehyde-activating enzyme [Candidatus Altiarchaeales archaeon HGW-Altiarchaeales-3]|nr:MAG: formaldehyde-activating enzyme [Candidatus Altiarchaeales archaeon HGW-Altiarchaeales-3]